MERSDCFFTASYVFQFPFEGRLTLQSEEPDLCAALTKVELPVGRSALVMVGWLRRRIGGGRGKLVLQLFVVVPAL